MTLTDKLNLLRAQFSHLKDVQPEAAEVGLKLIAAVERQNEALKFYGAFLAYEKMYNERPHMPFLVDRGERARTALADIAKILEVENG